MPWSYYASKSYATIYSHLDAIAAGDFNGDGRNDVALVTSFQLDIYEVTPDDGALFVFYQTAQGALAEPVRYSTAFTDRTRERSLSAGDVNCDGRTDLVIGNFDSIEVFTQTTQGTLQQNAVLRTAFSAQIKLGDINGDGRTDIASTGYQFNQTKLLFGCKRLKVKSRNHNITMCQIPMVTRLRLVIFNGDGRKDVAMLNFGGFANTDILVYLQDSIGPVAVADPI